MSLDITLTKSVFKGNLTHNLGKMASECGLYEPMWRPHKLFDYPDEQEDACWIIASDLIEYLEKGIEELKANPEKYKKLNPENGWGDYDGLLKVAEEYLVHCKVYPDADVSVNR